MNKIVMLVLISTLFTFSFIGCGKSHNDNQKQDVVNPKQNDVPTPDKVEPQPQPEPYIEPTPKPQPERVFHDDVEIIHLWGFEDACKNCNRGYRTKVVCGYAYNPDCAALLSTEARAETNQTKLIMMDILNLKTLKGANDGN